MAAIELGTWQTRAGYIGDVACTRIVRSLAARDAPEETDLMSMMVHRPPNEEEDGLVELWSLNSFQKNTETHIAYLRSMKRWALGCDSLDDPLTLVVPELWHERLDVIGGIFELVLEDGEITNSLYCTRPSVCWALASGKASAVVLDVGHSHTTVAGVLDGYALRHTVDSAVVGGAAVTAQYAAMTKGFLSSHLPSAFLAVADRPGRMRHIAEDHAADLKRLFGFVSTGTGTAPDDNPAAARQPLCTPDGSTLALTVDQRCAPFEIFFGRDAAFHVADMLARCKRRSDPEWQVRTIPHVLAGAGSRVKGFHARLLHEIKEKDAAYFRYERDGAVSVARSASGAWMGASMAAASSAFDPLWVTRAEWEEEGESVLYRKLFY